MPLNVFVNMDVIHSIVQTIVIMTAHHRLSSCVLINKRAVWILNVIAGYCGDKSYSNTRNNDCAKSFITTDRLSKRGDSGVEIHIPRGGNEWLWTHHGHDIF